MQDLEAYKVIGAQPSRFDSIFTSNLKSAINAGKATFSALVGYFGMGKTLILRKQLRFSIRTYNYVLPIYIPLRSIAQARLIEGLDLLREFGVREPSALTLTLADWYMNCKEFLGGYEWDHGESLSGVKRKRIDVLRKAIEANPRTIEDLAKVVAEQEFVPVLAIDETEALILRQTRQSPILLQRDDSVGTCLIEEVLKDLYIVTRMKKRVPCHITIATALDIRGDDWIRIPLQELARYPDDYSLEKLLKLFGISDRDLRKVKEAHTYDERLEIANELASKYSGRLPFTNPAIKQHLENVTVELRYTSDEYAKFLSENLGIRVTLPILTHFFEHAKISFRTLVRIAQELHSMKIEHLDYNALSAVFRSRVTTCYEVDTELKNSKVIPKHSKWLTRVCGLIEEGIIALPRDIAPLIKDLDETQRVKLCKEILGKLCKVLDIPLGKCGWWSADCIMSIRSRIESIRLKWGAIKVIIGRHGTEFYAVDEVLIRLILNDPYDLIGNTIDFRDYVRQLIHESRKSRR